MTRADETRNKVVLGVQTLEALVRGSSQSARGYYQYEGRISIKEVLRLGGIKSAATLHHAHHHKTRTWLKKKIAELKALAGRVKVDRRSTGVAGVGDQEYSQLMAQHLAAANYRIFELEQERDALLLQLKASRKVVSIRKKNRF